MTNFKKHDGLIFRMLEEPVPLTPDAEMPCLVRFIMPFLERFKGKHDGVAFFCDAIKKNPLYGNRLYAYETRRIGCIAEPRELEIIGYPVADGSAEWALYQMMQGKMVCHKTSRWDWYRMYNDHAIQNRTAGCMPRVSAWLESTVQSGWQIYHEQKPLLAEAKVGDLCQRRDGKWVQIDRLLSIGGMPWICYEIGGLRYINNGEQLNSKLSELGIIFTESLATEGSAEWAWQMAKLGIETRCYKGKIRVSKSGLIEVCYNGMAYAMPLTQSAENRQYVINKIRECSPDGWQIYEKPKEEPKLPKEPIANCENCKHVCTNSNIDHCQMYEPKPESQYKVGDCRIEFVKQELRNLLDKI